MPTPRSVIAEENEGLLKPGNLDLTKRPSVPNPAGGTSSVYSMSVGFDDGEYLIPRVSEDGRLMNEDEAIAEFKKTGNHLGVFKSPEAATKYSESLHKQQAEAGDFDVLFQRAVNHPGFRELEPDKQRQVIWKLMDRDERTKPLDDNKRMEFIGKYVEAKTPRDIYNLPLEELTPEEQLSMGPTFGGQPIGRIRGVRQAEQAVKSALGVGIPRTVEGLGPIIRSGGQAAEDFLNAASERLAGSRPFDLSSDIDALERGAEAAFGPTAEWAEKIANDKRFFPEIDRTSWAEVKKSEGALDTVFNFTDWVAGGAADTFGAMAPSIWLTAVTGAPIWATMVPTMTGFQSESFREQGVEATDLELVLSGVTQSVLGAKFGVESLIGAAPNSFIKNIFSNGFRRGLWRSAGGVAGELTTEFAQEYINQQLPLWEKGDQQFWNNLNPAQKTEIVEGAMLAGVLQVPASVVGAAEVGWTEQAMDNAKKKLEALQRLRSMTPEERGAEGFVAAPRAVRPLTEDQIRQIYTNHAPEFLTDEQKTAFVLGELDTTQFPPDQQAEIEAARLAAEEEIGPQEDTAVEVVPPEQQTEQQRTGIDEIKALAILRQQQLTAEGNAEGAAEIQEAIDSIEIVQAKDAKLRTIQGFAARFAPSVTFYRAKNGHLLGSDGVSVGTNGDVFVRWDASEAHLIAAVTLHEVIHTVGKSNFDAMVALYNTLKQTLPKRVAEYETWLRNEYANIGQTLSEKDLIQETVAYIGQDNAQEIFRALQVASQNIDVKSPGPIKSLIKAMWDTVKKITKGVPGTKNLFGPAIDAEFDINNKQDYTRLANQFVKFLQTGQRESLNIQPDNFGRRGRKQLDISEAPVPPPRTPTIEEDIPPRRPLRITEDRGKRAGKRPVYDASQREPGPPEFEPRGEKLIVGEAERVEPVQAETARKAVQRELLETPEKPAEVRLGPKPREAVREPRKPTILLDEPMVRTTAAKLEVGDELEIDDEVVSVTRAELKNGKRVIHYVNRDGDVSRVTVAPTKRFMKFENPQEEALGTDQPNLFESGKKLSPEQQRLNFDAMLAEEKEIAKIASDTNFALSARPYASISEEMSDDMDVEALGRLMDIDQEITGWMRYQPPGVRPYILADETGLRGFMLMRERLHYTKDHEAYFEYIAALYDKKGNRLFGMDRYNKLGIRNVIALGPFLAKEYPNAIWAGGHRIGGTRAAETAREDVEEYTRVPVYSLRDRRAGNVPSWWDDHLIEEGSVPHSWLEQQYSFSDLYGFTPAEQTAALSSAEAELRAAEEAAGLEQGLSDQEIRAILEVEEDTVRERYDQNTTMSMDDYLRIQLALSRIDEDGNPAESTETEAAQSMRQQYERDPETFFSFSLEDMPAVRSAMRKVDRLYQKGDYAAAESLDAFLDDFLEGAEAAALEVEAETAEPELSEDGKVPGVKNAEYITTEFDRRDIQDELTRIWEDYRKFQKSMEGKPYTEQDLIEEQKHRLENPNAKTWWEADFLPRVKSILWDAALVMERADVDLEAFQEKLDSLSSEQAMEMAEDSWNARSEIRNRLKGQYSFSNKAGKPVAKFTSDDWNALGEKHGVANLGGMRPLINISSHEIDEEEIYYHGTDQEFRDFQTGVYLPRQRIHPGDVGAWFAQGEGGRRTAEGFGKKVVAVKLTIKNPKVYATYDDFMDDAKKFKIGINFQKSLIKDGYDGIIIRESQTDSGAWRQDAVAFSNDQIEVLPDPVMIPGGLDGTFTYEEILWLKHQAIDTSKLDERVHLELHKKIVRTMQPDPRDTLQTLNNFIFSMLSPNQPLTPNELAYATVRVRNDEESREWAARIPWDAPSGEEPSLEVLERDGNRRAATTFIINYFKNTEALPAVKSAKQAFFANPGEFRKAYRSFYNERITREFNLQARERKGLGLLGTAEMTNVAELNQYYQIDPGWFQMQESDVDKNGMPSWHTYVERLSTQFRGMSTKVSSFAAVWQDPMNAAISAIDRHMGQQFEAELFNTPQERLEWEIGVLERWNASQKSKKEGKITPRVEDGQLKNFDELFMAPSGDGFFVEELMTKIGSTTGVLFEAVPESRPAYTKMRPKPATFEKWNKQRQDDWLAKEEARAANAFSEWKARNAAKVMNRNKKLPPHWKQWTGNFISLPEGRTVQLMSDAYRNALSYNAEKAEQLGIGLFSSQWFLWDRYRRRLEPHEVNFPGLYKLPHLDKSQIAAARKAHSKAGYLSGTKERVPILDSEGRPTESVDIRMKPVRTAPLGSLNYYSFSEGPGHFPSGQGFRTPLYNLHQAQPLSGVNPQSGPAWGLPEKTWKTYLINKFQDKFYRVKQLQREIERRYGNIHEDMDVYLTEMLYHGKAADQVEKFEHEYVDPLLKSLHANNVDIAEFEEWLHARHAEERNAHLDEIWENRKRRNLEKEIGHIENQIEYANDQGIDTTILKRRLHRKKKELAFLPRNRHHSGMSNAQAAAILKKAGNKFDAQAALFDKMMAQKLDILYRAGLITDEELKKVSVYKYYVPLKGKEYKGDLEEILEDANIHTGQGFDIRGDELGFSFGRVGDTKHTRPVLAQAVVDIEEAIVRANKNEVGKAFLDLVNQFPNESLYKVNSVTRRRVWDKKTGTVRLVKDAFANREDNVVAVKDGGKTHYIEIYDARLATAMKNLGSGPMHGAVRLVAAFNRFMAAANTTYNPEFIIANLLRDVQTAGLNMSTEELGALRNTTLLNVPKAINAIRKAEGLTSQDAAEVEQDEWVRYFREYVEDGGKIGFFGYTDVVSKARAIQRKVERAGDHKVYTTFSYMQSVADLVSKANSSVENASRLSVYVAARQAGISRKKAAAIGRNLTVNFNKKGDAGQVLNALYLFSNASIQGTARMFGAVLGSKHLQKLVGAQIAASWAIAAMNRGLGGEDDEDGYPWWEKVGDWEKERSLIIMLPEAQGHHIKIPLPYGYNVFHVIGTQMEAVSHAILSGTSTVEGTGKGVANLFAAVMTAFNPLGGMSLDSKWQMLRPLIPSAGAPIFDTFVNQTYYGAPIAPVRSSWDHSPESQRYFKSVNPLVKELTAYLNRWTGGSEYESGWLDQNPETLEYLLGSYAGAGAKTVVRTLFTDPAWVFSALTGRDTSKYEMNDVAFLRRIFGEVNDYTAAAVFYENIPVLSQAEEAYKNLKGQQLEDWKEDNAWMIPLFKKLTEAEKGIRDTEDPDAKNKIRKRFNKEYREAWLSQF